MLFRTPSSSAVKISITCLAVEFLVSSSLSLSLYQSVPSKAWHYTATSTFSNRIGWLTCLCLKRDE